MVTIDTLRGKDLHQLAVLYEMLSGCASDAQLMKRIFSALRRKKDYILLAAREDGALAGTVMGIVCSDLAASCRPFLVIENLVVREGSRGRGIATMLMNELERRARERDCWYMILVSGAARREAHSLYERLGFADERVRGFRKHL